MVWIQALIQLCIQQLEGRQPKMFKLEDYKFKGIYRAKVLDNNDPDMFGRIKAEVYSAFAGLASEEVPWAVPAYPIWEGSGNGIGNFAVPKIGSFVFVFFEGGDHNSPVYFAEAPTAAFGLPEFRTTNYPNRKGWRTESGIEFYVDDTAREVKLTHPSGTVIFIDGEGSITVTGSKDVTVNNNGNTTINSVGNIDIDSAGTIDIDSVGNMSINSSGETEIEATGKIDVTGSEVNLNP